MKDAAPSSPRQASQPTPRASKPQQFVDITKETEGSHLEDKNGANLAIQDGNERNCVELVGGSGGERDNSNGLLVAIQTMGEKIMSNGGSLYSSHFSPAGDDDISHMAVAPGDDESIDSIEGSEDKLFIEDGKEVDNKEAGDYDVTCTDEGKGDDIDVVEDAKTDRYGFRIKKRGSERGLTDLSRQGVELSEAEIKARRKKEGKRLVKWIKMIKQWEFTLSSRREKLKRRIRKGIPDAVRGKIWLDLLAGEVDKWRISHPTSKLDEKIRNGGVEEFVRCEIEKDVDRTFPNHEMFERKDADGQRSLRTILTRYAALDVEVGYCQGMGFVAAMMLTYMTEEDAFYCLVAVLNRPEAPYRLMYCPGLKEMSRFLSVFGDLGCFYLPKLWDHLKKQNVHQNMYLPEWVMTVFTRNFSFEFVTRVWDIFIYEGMKILYRVCLGLLKSIEDELLSSEFDHIMVLIRNIPQSVDVESFLTATWSIPLHRSQIDDFNRTYDKKMSKSSSLNMI